MPLEMFVNQYVQDRHLRTLAVNISPTGLYAHKVIAPMRRDTRVVGLEFELPGTGEIIWARGEICHDALEDGVHGQGIRFAAMPRVWKRMIRDYVAELGRLEGGGLPV